MKTFDPDYKLLDEMYQDDYYPVFLVDKVKDELQKVIDLLESWTKQFAASMTSRTNFTRTTVRLKR